jgi:hypothetical protein
MAKQLINKVPDLLKAKGLGFEELRWGAKTSLNTAKRWADYDEAEGIDRIDIETVVNIAEFLSVGIADMFEIKEV